MSILRRKSRKPKPKPKPKIIPGSQTLRLQPKDRYGTSSRRYPVITVSSFVRDVSRVGVFVISDTGMAAGANLDEEEVDMLIKGLRDALEESKAIAAGRESQEASQGG
jgi:hypothetical protein